jgi:5'-methylthioadenosine/S-adenosylhomocysteine nucleosidase
MEIKMTTSSQKHIQFGIVCAVDEEFNALCAKLSSKQAYVLYSKNTCSGTFLGVNVVIMQSGIGNINSAMTTASMITTFDPSYLLFSGIAGSLSDSLSVGDVLVGTSTFLAEAISHEQLRATWDMPPLTIEANADLVAQATEIATGLPYPVTSGVIVSSDIYPAPENYTQLFEQEQAVAIDMETAAFYRTCHEFKKPCLCIRSFSNPVTNAKSEVLESKLINLSSNHSSDFCFRLLTSLIQKHQLTADMESTADKLIRELRLAPHPEGGFFYQTYKSENQVGVSVDHYSENTRSAGTSILYLLKNENYSAWHRVKSDETWSYHLGGPIAIHMINPSSKQYQQVILGNPLSHEGSCLQFTVPANIWFAASLHDSSEFTLVGCLVTPGFEYSDFDLANEEEMLREFSEHRQIISKWLRKTPCPEPNALHSTSSSKNHKEASYGTVS